MRYAPAENLIRLARLLAQTSIGLTIEDMMRALDVSRRTAERLRSSLSAVFDGLEFHEDEARLRRWKLPRQTFSDMSSPTVEVVATVDTAAREYDQRGEGERADLLRQASSILRVIMRPERLRRAEPDLEALMEAEGIAMRPGPRPVMGQGLLSTLRRAILSMNAITVEYRSSHGEETTRRLLCPYGILYGGRGWLVAHQEDKNEMRLWRLDRLVSVELLDRNFNRGEEFSLRDYAAKSFGVYQEPPIDVELKFSSDVAADAAQWQFHPSQQSQTLSDGSVIVRFRAGGAREICHHLLTWGEKVVVLAPKSLTNHLADMSKALFDHHGFRGA